MYNLRLSPKVRGCQLYKILKYIRVDKYISVRLTVAKKNCRSLTQQSMTFQYMYEHTCTNTENRL